MSNAGTVHPRSMDFGLLVCRTCGLISRQADAGAGEFECPRCGTALHARKPDSLMRCTAYLIAAAALYLPANMLPVMQTNNLFFSQRDTILSGVVYLWTSGSWVLALIVFGASVVIPLAKIMSLGYLVLSVRRGNRAPRRQRSRLYRAIDAIGHWSMLDVYVVALLTALVRLRPLAQVDAGPGALAFGAVVVLTIMATRAFDSRLIWDASRPLTDRDHGAAERGRDARDGRPEERA